MSEEEKCDFQQGKSLCVFAAVRRALALLAEKASLDIRRERDASDWSRTLDSARKAMVMVNEIEQDNPGGLPLDSFFRFARSPQADGLIAAAMYYKMYLEHEQEVLMDMLGRLAMANKAEQSDCDYFERNAPEAKA